MHACSEVGGIEVLVGISGTLLDGETLAGDELVTRTGGAGHSCNACIVGIATSDETPLVGRSLVAAALVAAVTTRSGSKTGGVLRL